MFILATILSSVFALTESLENVETIEIHAKELHLSLEKSESSNLEWSSDREGNWELKKENGVLKFQSQSSGKVQLDIKAPTTELRYFADKSEVRLKDWMSPLYLRSLELDLDSENSAGDWDIYSQKGNLSIKNHGGNIESNLVSGKTVLKNIKGNINIEQFSGAIEIQEAEGDISIQTQRAKTKLLASKGSLNYESLSGEILLDGFSGELKGESASGLSILKPSANTKIDWRADQGGLRLGLRQIDGAYVDLATKEGNMILVPPLKAKNEGLWRVARAKLRGSEPGSIRVRTNKASIQLQYD